MKLMDESGLISYVGKVNMDRNAPTALLDASAESSAEETVRLIEAAKRFRRTARCLLKKFYQNFP